jgi:hypothetical protein
MSWKHVFAATLMLLGCFCSNARAEATLDWMLTVKSDDFHNAFTDLAIWHGKYYLCFRQATAHMSMDGEICVMSSPDMKTWSNCIVLNTFGDDRDPHFTVTNDELFVYFGVWDLSHSEGSALPDRNCVRSYFASTRDGEKWSEIRGVYEPGWWLWRVREHNGKFYSVAYTASRPKSQEGKTRFVSSENGLDWTDVSPLENDRTAGESDMLFRDDGSVWILSRTAAKPGNSIWFTGDAAMKNWQIRETNILIHAPVFARWKSRCFVGGRAHVEGKSVSRIWELVGEQLEERITLPSGRDNSYPGLIVDPASESANVPSLFVSWYSQHEKEPEEGQKKPRAAAIYVGRVTIP